MNFDHLKAEIARARVQIKRQQRDILDLQRAGISTVSAVALLERLQVRVDELIGERNRLTGEARVRDQPAYASGKAIRGVPASGGYESSIRLPDAHLVQLDAVFIFH